MVKATAGPPTQLVDARTRPRYNEGMAMIKVNNQLSLPEAIRKGKLEDVLLAIAQGEGGRIEMSDEECRNWSSDDGFVSAMEYAILRKRWPIAVALMHAPEDYLEKRECALSEKRAIAILDLFSALDKRRADKPLPAALCKQIFTSWRGFDEALAGQTGPGGEDAQAVFRIKSVAYQPGWLRLVPFMLQSGIPANQHAVDPHGYVSTLLRAAAIRGFKQDIEVLLASGANPLFKMHNGSLAAHDAVDLGRLRPASEPGYPYGIPSLDHIQARDACFRVLNALPGVATVVNWHGQTPDKARQAGLEWLAAQPIPEEPIAAAAYESRKLGMLTAGAMVSPPPRLRL